MSTIQTQPEAAGANALALLPAFLSLPDAARQLCCSRRFIEKRIEDGEIRVFRPSARLVRIRRTELERWIDTYSSTRSGAN